MPSSPGAVPVQSAPVSSDLQTSAAELAMPQCSAALLGLLGISAGAYVGFKLPEARK